MNCASNPFRSVTFVAEPRIGFRPIQFDASVSLSLSLSHGVSSAAALGKHGKFLLLLVLLLLVDNISREMQRQSIARVDREAKQSSTGRTATRAIRTDTANTVVRSASLRPDNRAGPRGASLSAAVIGTGHVSASDECTGQ